MRSVFWLFLFLYSGFPCLGQDCSKLYDQAYKLYIKDKNEKALQVINKALPNCRQDGNSTGRFDLLILKAGILYDVDDYDDAIETYRLADNFTGNGDGWQSRKLTVYEGLVDAFTENKQLDSAKETYEAALRFAEKFPMVKTFETYAQVLYAGGSLEKQVENYSRASDLFLKAYKEYIELHNDNLAYDALDEAADAILELEQYVRADSILKVQYAMLQRLCGGEEIKREDCATNFYFLALNYMSVDKNESMQLFFESEKLFQDLRLDEYSQKNFCNVKIYLAQVLRESGRTDEAGRKLKEAETIAGGLSDKSYIAHFYYAQAELLLKNDKLAEAEEAMLKSKSLYERLDSLSYDVALAHKQLAELYEMQNNSALQEVHLLRYKNLVLKINGRKDSYATACFIIGLAYQNSGQLLKAEVELLEYAQVYFEMDPAGQNYASALESLGDLYRIMDKYAKADSLYLRSISIFKENKEKGTVYADVQSDRAYTKRLQGDYGSAIELYREAMLLHQKWNGKGVSFAYNLSQIGEVFYEQGDYNSAYVYFKDALQLMDSLKLKTRYSSRLRRMAHLLFQRGEKQASINTMRSAYQYSVQNKLDPIYQAYALHDIGHLYNSYHQLDSAIDYLKAALTLYASLNGKNTDYCNVLSVLASSYYNKGLVDSAEARYIERSELFKAINVNSKNYAVSLSDLAGHYLNVEQLDKAESLYLESLTLEQSLTGNTISVANRMKSVGWFYYLTGDYAKADDYYENAKALIEPLNGRDCIAYASVLVNQALLLRARGLYTKAEELMERAKAIEIGRRGRTAAGYVPIVNNLGLLYGGMGNDNKAIDYYRQALAVEAQFSGSESHKYAFYLNNLARALTRNRQFALADSALGIVAKIRMAVFGESHPTFMSTRLTRALLDSYIGNYEDALEGLESVHSYRLKRYGPEHIETISVANSKAVVLELLNRNPQAGDILLRSLNFVKTRYGEHHPQISSIYKGIGKLRLKANQFSQARSYFQSMIGVRNYQIEKLFNGLSENQREEFYNSMRADFHTFNSYVLIEAGLVDFLGKKNVAKDSDILKDLYNSQISTKALLLNNSARIRKLILSGSDKVLQAKFHQWERLKGRLASLYQKTETDGSMVSIYSRSVRDSLEAEINLIEKELARKSERFAKESDKKKLSWVDVQAQLKQQEAAIEIVRVQKLGIKEWVIDNSNPSKPKYPKIDLTDTIIYVALILTAETKNGPDAVILKEGNAMDDEYLKNYQDAIYRRKDDYQSYNRYWKKIYSNRYVKNRVKKIFLSPDGVYNQISVNSLQNPETKEYVIDEISIQLVTNTKDIVHASTADESNYYGMLIGNPTFYREESILASEKRLRSYSLARGGRLSDLPGAELEVNGIKDLLDSLDSNWEINVHKGTGATEGILKNLEKPRVLHIATHGYFLQSDYLADTRGAGIETLDEGKQPSLKINPMIGSGLFLYGGGDALANLKTFDYELLNRDDGIFTAYEAMNLNIEGTELVVLSACETGLGEVNNGEGVYGLQRALKVAGANAIVMSLWSVSDESTMMLMREFYRRWLTSGDKLGSFRDAQLAVRNRREFSHPFFWGAFVMVGN